ncbi:MAG: carbon storage regulator [Gemmatimonadota bacterium]
MLILGRREGDSILIEGGIRIVIVSCDRGSVRIGIEAPPELKILRGEIAQQVAVENQRATAGAAAGAWLGALTGAGPDTTTSTVPSTIPITTPVTAPKADA